MFKMDNDETNIHMYNCFNDIVVNLKIVGSIENCHHLCLRNSAPRSLQLNKPKIPRL